MGVVLFISRQDTNTGRFGRVLIGLGLVLGANLGSGQLTVLTTLRSAIEVRQVPLGNLIFKVLGIAIAAPFVGLWLQYVRPYLGEPMVVIVLYHLSFNVLVGVVFIGWAQVIARWVEKLLPKSAKTPVSGRPQHLDPSALSTPSLAISCATREALHQADVVETMLRGMLEVIKNDDLQLGQKLRKMDDEVDELYSSIKYRLTKISREALDEEESRRWPARKPGRNPATPTSWSVVGDFKWNRKGKCNGKP